MTDWPFHPLKPLSYDLIMADPPWRYRLYSEKGEAKAPQSQYQCQDLDWIKALPVAKLARGDCLLMLWTTWPMLPQAFEVMDAWGFSYATGGPWVKRTKYGKWNFGTGYVLRGCSEPFLIGKVGSISTTNSVRGMIEAKVREHSRKPDEAFAMLEQLVPQALNRAELFADRRIPRRPGWDQWGDPHRSIAA